MAIYLDLAATSESSLGVGLLGPILKNPNNLELQLRNAADTTDAPLTVSLVKIGSVNPLVLKRNPSQASELGVTFPAAKATAGMVLAQKAGGDASEVELEFVSVSGTPNTLKFDQTALAFGSASEIAMFNLPAGSKFDQVKVIIDTPFSTGANISIGITGETSKYVASSQVNLSAAAGSVFILNLKNAAPSSQESVNIYYSAAGATAGAARILAYYGEPT